MDVEKYKYSIAASIVSSPTTNNIWKNLDTSSAYEIYENIIKKKSLKTQEYISYKYSSDPYESAQLIIEASLKNSIKIIDYWDNDYPKLLREIEKPPIVLYVRGELNNVPSIAMVGSRKSDARSKKIAGEISFDLSSRGYNIVSGMAIGIDREVHLGALNANGSTVGVLANGINMIYPLSNKDLYHKICSTPGSSLISEYPPEIIAGKWTFVRRNRIISGLSTGTVVVKAAQNSGALITARYALEQNREVFACTGYTFDDDYKGCHELIQNGAVLVSTSEDILKELSLLKNDIFYEKEIKNKINDADTNSQESIDIKNLISDKILDLLSNGEFDIDTIVRETGSMVEEINEALILLELSGKILKNGNNISRI